MLKNGASGVYRATSKLRLLGFLPQPQVLGHTQGSPGVTYPKLVCMCCAMHAPAGAPGCSQGSRGLGVTSQSLLGPHFRSSEVLPWSGNGRCLLSLLCLPVENLLAKQGCLLLLADSSLLEQPFNIFLDFLKQQTLDTLRTATTKSLSTVTFSEEPDVFFNQVMENSFLF